MVHVDVVLSDTMEFSKRRPLSLIEFKGAVNFSEELINVFTLMIDEQISILSMSDFISPYPTYGNIFHTLSRDYLSFMSAHWKSHPIGSIKQIIRYIYS